MSQRFPILLVEDDHADAHLALAMLSEVKMDEGAFHVTDGLMAMDYLLARGPFADRSPELPIVVLLDLKLPRINGFEVLQHVRAAPALRHMPVVILSSSDEDGDVRRAYELGANAYVLKSIDFDTYRSSLRAIGFFWGAVNEPPPPCLRRERRR
jgi:CheY-like chemotaxis protein